jgi:hypothetical protein
LLQQSYSAKFIITPSLFILKSEVVSCFVGKSYQAMYCNDLCLQRQRVF